MVDDGGPADELASVIAKLFHEEPEKWSMHAWHGDLTFHEQSDPYSCDESAEIVTRQCNRFDVQSEMRRFHGREIVLVVFERIAE